MTTEKAPATSMVYDILPERMPQIPEEQLSDEQRAVLAELAASRGSVRGSFVALVRAPKLMDRMQKMGAYVRFEASLDLRVNRVASLLTTTATSSNGPAIPS